MNDRRLVRTAQEIKDGLLKRAWNKSEEEGKRMELMVAEASARANTISDEHREALREIDDTQPRSVMRLNALAKEAGANVYSTDTSLRKPTIH